ncbi:MFS transporter [Marinibaculum pumilum]|uniref:MFS transporter n=1 Tax=Marinibaculum pumilum TaxID=1766165 RepID=A0ABV7L9I8_9PROT
MATGQGLPQDLPPGRLPLYAVAVAVVAANAYYFHPIIGLVVRDLQVDAATIGLVPALNQVALALGILLLLPLGDRFSNRTMVTAAISVQALATLIMALAESFPMLLLGSTLLGFATLAPYLMPAYVSKRVEKRRLGQATAWLTTGVVAGVLFGRGIAGPMAEAFGWRSIFFVATGLLLLCAIGLPRLMERGERSPAGEGGVRERLGYLNLLLSIGPIVRRHPEALLSGAIQGLSFGVFLALWLALGLHLTSPRLGHGADVVSYLAILSGVGLLTTPSLGRLADRIGARRARTLFLCLQMVAIGSFAAAGDAVWWMAVPAVLMGISGPITDVSGRMTILGLAPEIRTRLMTVYVVLMFAGGGIASWLSTFAYDLGGWTANVTVAALLSGAALVLSAWSLWRWGR